MKVDLYKDIDVINAFASGKSDFRQKTGYVEANSVERLIEMGPEALKEHDIETCADGSLKLHTWSMQDGSWKEETVNTVSPTDVVIENVVDAATGRVNRYAMGAKKFASKYVESSVGEDIYEPLSRGFFIRNPKGTDIVIDASWGEPQDGDADCFVVIALVPLAEGQEAPEGVPTFEIDGRIWIEDDRYLVDAGSASATYVIVPDGPKWPTKE